MHSKIRPTVAMLILALLAMFTSPHVARAQAAEQCFPETGNCVSGAFLDYWLANGSLAQQGLPITGVLDEQSALDGQTYRVQYFERARFEWHPENPTPYSVLLGLLGVEQFAAKYGAARPGADGGFGGGAECASFSATGQEVCGPFLAYWRSNGGLAQQGQPISGTFVETSPSNGQQYRVQYFERARFEYHPENPAPYQVLLGLLGGEQFAAKSGQQKPLSAPTAHQPNANEDRLVELMRTHPQQQRATMRYNPVLARVARERASDMAARGYFGHTNPDGWGPNALVRQAGYLLPSYYGVAPDTNNIESIGAGPATADEVWQLFLNSAAHRAHLLGLTSFYAEQVEYGIGYVAAPGTTYGHYWVIITARPGP